MKGVHAVIIGKGVRCRCAGHVEDDTGDIMAAKPTFQKLGAFTAPFSDDADANAVQPVYGDIGWAGLKYTKSPDMVLEWIDFFGQKDNFQSFMQVLQYYPTQTVQLTGPVPEAEAPLLKKTAVSK